MTEKSNKQSHFSTFFLMFTTTQVAEHGAISFLTSAIDFRVKSQNFFGFLIFQAVCVKKKTKFLLLFSSLYTV